jgi:ankyrin repeat domain-containing protein 17
LCNAIPSPVRNCVSITIFLLFIALTIAADKGHHKFVELLLLYGATIDVRNKKGATPLWLACNNGHLEVVQLLVTRFANPDSSDSRKVSCLMAAFRKGHIKVVKYLVRQVRQFPSDTDCRRLISTITDKVNSTFFVENNTVFCFL